MACENKPIYQRSSPQACSRSIPHCQGWGIHPLDQAALTIADPNPSSSWCGAVFLFQYHMGLSSITGHSWRALNKFDCWFPFLPFHPRCIYLLIYFSFRFSFLYLLFFERPNNGIEMPKTAGNGSSALASHRSFQCLVDTVAGVPAQLYSVFQRSSTPVDWMFANTIQSGEDGSTLPLPCSHWEQLNHNKIAKARHI